MNGFETTIGELWHSIRALTLPELTFLQKRLKPKEGGIDGARQRGTDEALEVQQEAEIAFSLHEIEGGTAAGEGAASLDGR